MSSTQKILERLNELDQKLATNYPGTDLTAKGAAGIGASFASMSLNEILGAIVAMLTIIYMLFQIEAAFRRFKNRQKHEE